MASASSFWHHALATLAGAFSVMLQLVANACSADRESAKADKLVVEERLLSARDTRSNPLLALANNVPTPDDRIH